MGTIRDNQQNTYIESPTRVNKKAVEVVTSASLGAFGETQVIENTSILAGDAIYGFIPSNFRTFSAGSGSTSVDGKLFKCQSGTSLGDYGAIQSLRSLNYKTGQGSVIRFSARFDQGVEGIWSGVGGVNIGDEVSFGYNGVDFGVWHRYGGVAEIRTIQITTPAGGAETLTLVLNGVSYSIALTSGTVQHNAYEIATYLTSNGSGFGAEQLNDEVIITYLSDGAKNSTFSFSSTGACAATITRTKAGVTKTSEHHKQSEWNGVDFSSLDPSKGNTYQIIYQNGFGDIKLEIENAQTGNFSRVHTIRWSNENTAANIGNPSLRVGMYSTNVGSAQNVSVYAAYMYGAVEGSLEKTRNPRAFSSTKSIGTTLTNLLTIRNKRQYNGFSNQVEIEPVFVTLANDGTKSAVFEILGNPTVSGEPNYQDVGNNIVAESDIAGTTVTGGRRLASFTVAKGQSISINLTQFNIRIPPTLRLVIAAKMASGSSADLTAALTWYEDI